MRSIYQFILFSFFAFVTHLTFGQQTITLDLEWESELVIENGDTTVVQNCSYCALDENKEAYIIYTITDPIDSVWINTSKGEFLLGYDTQFYSSLAITEEKVISGTREITNIQLPAYYSENNNVKKLKSVSISYSLQESQFVASTRNKKSASYATESKLKSGTWYKLEVREDGVYKLDANYLSSLGFDISSLDPKKIKIYGSGNAMLPQQNNLDRPDDLVENAIYVSSTGTFSSSDYVLFYGQSPHKLVVDTTNRLLSHKKNLYTESSYYFITTEGDNGLRIGTQNTSGTSTQTVTTFDEYVYQEKDAYNALKSGRSWYAENFDFHTDKQFSISTPDKVNNSSFRYRSAVMAQAYASNVDFTISLNGQVIGVQEVSKNSVSSKGYGVTGYDKITDYNLDYSSFSNTSSFDINVNFVGDANNNANSQVQTHGYVNYLGLQYTRNLSTTQSQVVFRCFESLNQQFTAYQLGLTSSYSVWNITDPLNPSSVSLQSVGNKLQFVEDALTLNQFILFNNTQYLVPSSSEKVANQNLHGINSVPNLVIISHSDYVAPAQKLADYRASQGLSYLLVTPEQIYNEFSSGAQDITGIRDFMKMLFDRDSNALQYLLFFGAASYDYKDVLEENTNFIPTYQSIESLHNVQTYASDDYYGFLRDGDGEWKETSSNANNHESVIAVGRIPLRYSAEYHKYAAVDKIIHYEKSKESIGGWRRNITFLADDGDNHLHEKDANNLASYCAVEYPSTKQRRLFLDDYKQYTGVSVVSPEFESEYDQLVNDGSLIFNYSGHGAEYRLAFERIIENSDINKQENMDRLPLYITATCEFGRFDNPAYSSGAMTIVNRSGGGGIATISTTRPVYASSNYIINEAFYQFAFQRKADSSYLTLGESFMLTKNNSFAGLNNRNFSLLGDPCLKLSLPENKIIIDKFNNNTISTDSDTLKALSEVTLQGIVTDGFENVLTDFDGILYLEVFDKESEKTTLGSVGGSTYTYKERSSYLFAGEATVTQGVFSVSFPVPKDISYAYELGKINMYAYRNDSLVDAAGNYTNLVIGGTDPNAKLNNDAPLADLFMDDESFVYGGNTASTTLFIAELSDDNGINITNTSIGHELTLVVDGDREKTIVLNEFYTANVDDYKNGRVEYELSGLSDGTHHLNFTAWDTHNNPVVEELEFVVGADFTFYTYPNPFIDETTLFIDHSGGEQTVVVTVTIVDDKGSEMLTQEYEYDDAPNVIDNIVWDGTLNGTPAAAGLYFIKVQLQYPDSGTSASKIHKVVLLH